MKRTESISYIGVNDHRTDLFEGQYRIPNGIAYNSYVIMDEKIAVMDTVDAAFTKEWLDSLASVLNQRTPDYLIVQHMEPDHSASIAAFTAAYPSAVLVASKKAFVMMKQFFGTEFTNGRIVIKEDDTLTLGVHTLTFLAAPMVHWPEVIVTYDSHDKILFSADAFGKFGALDVKENWADEARRYYIGIVGKYGSHVQRLLQKVKKLELAAIYPLHGPVLTENLSYYLKLYELWSSYRVEREGIVIAFTSVYGNTKKAVQYLAKILKANGSPEVVLHDLTRCDMATAVADAFCYGTLVLATTTYNGEVFPFMREYLHHLTERNFQNRTIGIIENGSWAPVAKKYIRKHLDASKNLNFTKTTVTIYSALDAQSTAQLDALAQELLLQKE